MYGTRQAGLLFYKKLSGFLINHGFSQSYGDRCVFMRAMKDGKVIEQGATEAIFDKPVEPYTKALMAAAFDMEFDERTVAEGIVRM